MLNEPNNKIVASKPSALDSNKLKKSFLSVTSIVFVLCGTLSLVLGASLHEFYGVISPAFFVAATLLMVKTQKGEISWSTVYTAASIITGSIGVLFMILGLHVHPVFAYGVFLLYFCAASGIFCFVIIVSRGEILKISGIVKVVLLFAIGVIIARFVVVILQKVRYESKKAHVPQEQTQLFEKSGEPILD